MPYRMHVSGLDGEMLKPSDCQPSVSAGRSSRYHGLLVQIASELDLPARIVSDSLLPANRQSLLDCVEVLDKCDSKCLLKLIAESRFVVIPLTATDISAGQMVLMQGMAYGRPVIITRTRTTEDYVTEEDGVMFVEPGDPESLRESLLRLSRDDALCDRLGERAAHVYAERFSIDGYARNLVRVCRLAEAA